MGQLMYIRRNGLGHLIDVNQEKGFGAVDVLAVAVHQEKQLGAVDVHQLNSTQLKLSHSHLVQVWLMKLFFALPL